MSNMLAVDAPDAQAHRRAATARSTREAVTTLPSTASRMSPAAASRRVRPADQARHREHLAPLIRLLHAPYHCR
jgi:hypothetical protein